MPYTSNKKPSGLDAATTPLVGANEVVLSQAGNVTRASLTAVEAMVHAANAKTAKNPVDGTEVVTVRQTDNVLRQVALDNIVKPLLITNAMVSNSAAIVDSKLNTISTGGKVSNSATTATNANTANAIVARDGSGNFAAGTITATLSGNATTATTLATGRTIAMTGDVAYTSPSFNGSANVTAAATIQPDAVTTAKILNLNVTTAKIADDAVTFLKMQQSAAAGLSVVGRNINSTGDFAEINAGTDGHVLRRSGTDLAFGQIATAGIADSAVTNVKIASGVDAAKLTTGTLDIARITDGTVTNAKLASGIDAGKLTAGTLPIARIADTAVTFAKLQNSAAAGLSVVGRTAQSAGSFAEITALTDGHVLRRSGTTIGFGTIANSATTATNVNTASTIVARDASGNFLAGTITAALTGNVTGNVTGSSGSCSGNAATASTWLTARTLTVGGTGKSVNGGGNVSWSLSEIGAPSTTGTGASGTWGINITGNAATVTDGLTTSNYSSYALPLTGGTITGDITAYRPATTGDPARSTTGVIYLGSNAEWRGLFYDGYNYQMPRGQLYVNDSLVLNVGNYNTYAPTLTGTGASGTWNISIFGSASSASNATNASYAINAGTAFGLDSTVSATISNVTVTGAITASGAAARLSLPQLSTTQRNNYSPAPTRGMIIYNTSDNSLNVFNGSVWKSISLL